MFYVFTKAFVCFEKRARVLMCICHGDGYMGSSNLQLRYKAKHIRLCKSFINYICICIVYKFVWVMLKKRLKLNF